MPCFNPGPSFKPDGYLEDVKRVCPNLIDPDNPEDTKVCCQQTQLESLEDQIVASELLFGRCPSCYANFRNLYCYVSLKLLKFIVILKNINEQFLSTSTFVRPIKNTLVFIYSNRWHRIIHLPLMTLKINVIILFSFKSRAYLKVYFLIQGFRRY